MEASRARGGDAGPSSGSARPRSGGAAAGEGAGDQRTAPGGEGEAVYEAVHYDGNAQECGHVVTTACVQNGVRSVLRYAAERAVGNGSFGVVFQATCVESRETVAIKRVLQDKRFKNRELQIMRLLDHPNVVKLKHSFYSTAEREDVYLNLVLEFVPDTVYRIIKHYSKRAQVRACAGSRRPLAAGRALPDSAPPVAAVRPVAAAGARRAGGAARGRVGA